MKTKLLFGLLFIAALQFTNAQSVGLVGAFNAWGDNSQPDYAPDVNLTSTDNINYTLSGWTLAADSDLKFRQNSDWTVNWGGGTFPSGTGTQDGANIPVVAGTYDVTFNITTGVYMFSTQSIGLVGAFNAWGDSSQPDYAPDVNLTSTDNINYTLSGWTLAADSDLKFRQNNDWTVNWGGGTFPSGTGTQDGANIPVVAGTYDVTFNFTTGDYNFATSTLAVDDFTKNIQFYYVNNALKINGYNGQASIKAYDVVGRLLYNKENVRVQNGFSQNIKLPKYQVSFILIKGENFKKSLKVVAQ
jgi:starch-binding outer membrane protein SusE/F